MSRTGFLGCRGRAVWTRNPARTPWKTEIVARQPAGAHEPRARSPDSGGRVGSHLVGLPGARVGCHWAEGVAGTPRARRDMLGGCNPGAPPYSSPRSVPRPRLGKGGSGGGVPGLLAEPQQALEIELLGPSAGIQAQTVQDPRGPGPVPRMRARDRPRPWRRCWKSPSSRGSRRSQAAFPGRRSRSSSRTRPRPPWGAARTPGPEPPAAGSRGSGPGCERPGAPSPRTPAANRACRPARAGRARSSSPGVRASAPGRPGSGFQRRRAGC